MHIDLTPSLPRYEVLDPNGDVVRPSLGHVGLVVNDYVTMFETSYKIDALAVGESMPADQADLTIRRIS